MVVVCNPALSTSLVEIPRAVRRKLFSLPTLSTAPGVSLAIPSKPTMPFCVSSSCEKAVMLMGTSRRRSLRRVAVTG